MPNQADPSEFSSAVCFKR